jgi:hypothetical protein
MGKQVIALVNFPPKQIRKILFLSLFVFGLMKIPKNYFHWTGGFRPAKCEIEVANCGNWETGLPDEKTKLIFSQPFNYFKRGSQSYVFQSLDGQYVLKIFSQPLLKRKLREIIGRPFPRPDKQKIIDDLNGYRIAKNLPIESTGIVYFHLNTTQNLLPQINLKDALGRTQCLPLDRCRFVLQKKSIPLARELRRLAQAGQTKEIEKLIDSYRETIASRTQLGIRNADTDFKHNFGVLEGKVIEFDFGEFRNDLFSEEGKSQELFTFMDRLRYWMGEFAPEYEDSVRKKI